MHNPALCQSWEEGKDYKIFMFPDQNRNTCECLHCHKMFKNTNYLRYQHQDHCSMIQHKGKPPFKTMSIREYFTDERDEDSELIKLVKYVCENAIAINTTQSQTFQDLFKMKVSEETLRRAIIDYADKIKCQTKAQIKELIVSLILDGATINENSGWYALGLSTRTRVYFYEVFHMSCTTTFALTDAINKKIDEIQKETHAVIVGACTDNTPNISNVFSMESEDGLAQIHKKFLLRVSCQAHTANLVNTTYARDNPYYNRLRSIIKSFAAKLSEKKIHISLAIKNRCPLIRDQRWFTEYDALDWIIKNRKIIQDSWQTIKFDLDMTTCPISDEWELLLRALEPLRHYVECVETNICTIGKAWEHFVVMKKTLEDLSQNHFAKDLLAIVIQRWKSTSDANLLKLASFIKPYNQIQWKKLYEKIASKIRRGEASEEDKEQFTKMTEEADLMVDTTIKYGKHMGYSFEEKDTEILFLLTTATLSKNRVNDYYWEGMSSSSSNVALEASKRGIDADNKSICQISEFYNKLRSLPSSEAFCERIFANMRTLFPDSRYSCNDDLIASQTLIRMSLALNRLYID